MSFEAGSITGKMGLDLSPIKANVTEGVREATKLKTGVENVLKDAGQAGAYSFREMGQTISVSVGNGIADTRKLGESFKQAAAEAKGIRIEIGTSNVAIKNPAAGMAEEIKHEISKVKPPSGDGLLGEAAKLSAEHAEKLKEHLAEGKKRAEELTKATKESSDKLKEQNRTLLENLELRAKEVHQEKRKSGEGALSSLIKGGPEGLIEAAGMGVAVTSIAMAAEGVKSFAETISDLRTELDEGKIDAGEFSIKLAESVPVFGIIGQAAEAVIDTFTGEKEEIRQINEGFNAMNRYVQAVTASAAHFKQTMREIGLDQADAARRIAGYGMTSSYDKEKNDAKGDLDRSNAKADDDLKNNLEQLAKERESVLGPLRDKLAVAQRQLQKDPDNEEKRNQVDLIKNKILPAREDDFSSREKKFKQSHDDKVKSNTDEFHAHSSEIERRQAEEYATAIRNGDTTIADAMETSKEDRLKLEGRIAEAEIAAIRHAAEKKKAEVDRQAKEDAKRWGFIPGDGKYEALIANASEMSKKGGLIDKNADDQVNAVSERPTPLTDLARQSAETGLDQWQKMKYELANPIVGQVRLNTEDLKKADAWIDKIKQDSKNFAITERLKEEIKTPLQRFQEEMDAIVAQLGKGQIDDKTADKMAAMARKDTLGESRLPQLFRAGSAEAQAAKYDLGRMDKQDNSEKGLARRQLDAQNKANETLEKIASLMNGDGLLGIPEFNGI
jgi:hypothetical protein